MHTEKANRLRKKDNNQTPCIPAHFLSAIGIRPAFCAAVALAFTALTPMPIRAESASAAPRDSRAVTSSEFAPDIRSILKRVSFSADTRQDWNLILVNRWNPIPDDYAVTLKEMENKQAVDERIYDELQEMMDDAHEEGILAFVTSSYRTESYQQGLFNNEIAEYEAEGYDYEKAAELASGWVAIPGTSEHQIGLAVDIHTANSAKQESSVVWEWLEENCHKYGFIRRYPEDKVKLTGVNYEPWHFRYVGKEAALEIYQRNICLEEYIRQKQFLHLQALSGLSSK